MPKMPILRPIADQPKLMAIGDSLYNGTRSLTIDASKTALSPPALVASALGIRNFQVPDLPQTVVVDLEKWVRWLATDLWRVKSLVREDVKNSVKFWSKLPTSNAGAQVFDNIAFEGSTIEDMYTLTPRIAAEQAERAAKVILNANDVLKVTDQIAEFVLMANARYTMSPLRGPAGNPFWDLSPLQAVAYRKPSRLLVSIGHNNGFIDIVSKASKTGADQLTRQVQSKLPEFAIRLNGLPPEVGSIYFNLLPKPSAVSSLMPLPDMVEEDKEPDPSGYWPGGYENRMGFRYGRYSPERMREIDKQIAELNEKIKEMLKKDDARGRVRFVDNYALMEKYDSKNVGKKPDNVIVAQNVTHSNRMFLSGPDGLRAGGLQSLDGVHLTTVGSALLAREILKTISKYESVKYEPPSYEWAHRADTLLSKPPSAWSWALWAYRDDRKRQPNITVQLSAVEQNALRHTVGLALEVGVRAHTTPALRQHPARPKRKSATPAARSKHKASKR